MWSGISSDDTSVLISPIVEIPCRRREVAVTYFFMKKSLRVRYDLDNDMAFLKFRFSFKRHSIYYDAFCTHYANDRADPEPTIRHPGLGIFIF